MNMTNLNKNGEELIKGINRTVEKFESDEETISTSDQLLAVAYESTRNAVEFRSGHLVRQAAIVRILRRRLFLKQSSQEVASFLIKELIWAKYLKNNSVPVSKIVSIKNIVDKYRLAFSFTSEVGQSRNNLEKIKDENTLHGWLLELAGCEIEECLIFNPFPQLLINFVSESLQSRIELEGSDNEQLKDVQVYIATERVFAKNSEIFITYHLLKAFLPEWFQSKPEDIKNLFPKLIKVKGIIDADLNNPLGSDVKKKISKMVTPFNVIREVIIRNPKEFVEKVENQEEFDKLVKNLLTKLYAENRKRSRGAIIRSIIYIFLTKMILAIALELPYDLVTGRTNYLALGINLLFPPLLMVLLNARVATPGQENTEEILKKLREYLFGKTPVLPIYINKKEKTGGLINNIFLAIYTIFFIGIFVLIFQALSRLSFNIISKFIFIFFICVVSFFAYGVKRLSKDYVYQDDKEGIFSSLIDFIFLPILRVGQWLSSEVAKLNFLGLMLDFIIEAPLKALLEVIERWVHFVRAKKEEIFSE